MATIVYFDRSILSKLVNHRQGRIKDAKVSELYRQLDVEIQRCVVKGGHVFPESSTHSWEVQLDSSIDDAEWRYLKDISHGLRFTEYYQMLDMQISCALVQGLQDSQPQRGWWDNVFNRGANEPYVPDPYEVYARFQLSTEFIKGQRIERKNIPTRLAQIAPVTSKRTAAEQAECELSDHVLFLFTPWISQQRVDLSEWEKYEQENLSSDAVNRMKYLTERGLSIEKIILFMQSRELAQVPLLSIRSKLWGYLMVNAASRHPRGSDKDDIEIMAMTLPYCDIVTTDSYMQKVVIEDFKLADEYGTVVLSSKLKDVEKLTRLLSN